MRRKRPIDKAVSPDNDLSSRPYPTRFMQTEAGTGYGIGDGQGDPTGGGVGYGANPMAALGWEP